jgi:DNA-binding NtrC family response regulator
MAAEAHTRDSSSDPSILVVEDDLSQRGITAEYLRLADFNVVEVPDAQAAIAAIEGDTQVDLVFSDINMPGTMGGEELAIWLNDHYPSLPIILTSGAARSDLALQAPAIHFLKKPYPLSAMERIIRALLQARHPDGSSAAD